MEQDSDLKKILRGLKYAQKQDLVKLLSRCRTRIEDTGQFGIHLYSSICYFHIYAPLDIHDSIEKLPEQDKELIRKIIYDIYPDGDNAPEIRGVIYHPDYEKDVMNEEIISAPELQEIDFHYIKDQVEKCDFRIRDMDFEGAITISRALLESMFIYILEQEGVTDIHKGDLLKLYKSVKTELNISDLDDENIRQIVAGLTSVVNGLASLRNSFSDSHGKSANKYFKPSEHHAILSVNLAKSLSVFLYSSWLRKKSNSK